MARGEDIKQMRTLMGEAVHFIWGHATLDENVSSLRRRRGGVSYFTLITHSPFLLIHSSMGHASPDVLLITVCCVSHLRVSTNTKGGNSI